MLASASPEVIIGAIATAIEGIRLGGGVIVPHLTPLKVAEGVHGFVGAASRGVSILGPGSASGTDPLTAFALHRDRRDAARDDFPQPSVVGTVRARADDVLEPASVGLRSPDTRRRRRRRAAYDRRCRFTQTAADERRSPAVSFRLPPLTRGSAFAEPRGPRDHRIPQEQSSRQTLGRRWLWRPDDWRRAHDRIHRRAIAHGARACLHHPVLQSRRTGRVELHGAGGQGFRFGPADSESGSAATRPVSATIRKSRLGSQVLRVASRAGLSALGRFSDVGRMSGSRRRPLAVRGVRG
jgi:hypothetical protein